MYRRWITYEECDHRILAPGCFPHIKSRFLHLNLSSKSENITSRFFIGLWRSCPGPARTSASASERHPARREASAQPGCRDRTALGGSKSLCFLIHPHHTGIGRRPPAARLCAACPSETTTPRGPAACLRACVVDVSRTCE